MGFERKGLMSMRARSVLAFLLLILLAVAIVGCGKDETVRNKDSIVIAIGTEPATFDPTQGWGHGNSPIVQSTLVKYTSDLNFENDLAKTYKLSDDGLTWTFTVRDDAEFTDGKKVTASDIAFTLETAKAARGSIDLTYMKSAVAIDNNTVVITLSKPTSIFLNTLASIGIVPKHAYDKDYGIRPIGSGPYKLVEWKSQEQIMFTANENYYGGTPKIKDITVVFMSEEAALAAVQAGKVDVAYSTATLGRTKVDGYRIEAIKAVDNRGFTLPVMPNVGKKTQSGAPIGNNVTANIEIRKAIAYAIDRQAIVDVVLNGFGRPAYSENDGMPWNNPEIEIKTNLGYARKLLSDAGWGDTNGDGIVEKAGVKAEFSCLYPAGDSARQAIAMAAAEQVKNIGIKINVLGRSWDEIMKLMFSEAVVMGWGSSVPNETYYLYRSAGALKDDFYNPEGYMSDVTDTYLNAAMSALTVEEANKYWQKVQWDGNTGTAMMGECPWVWIVNLDHVTYIREGLSIGKQPIHGHGHGVALIQNLHEWEWQE